MLKCSMYYTIIWNTKDSKGLMQIYSLRLSNMEFWCAVTVQVTFLREFSTLNFIL